MLIFLGGTCGNNKWRDKLIPMLLKGGVAMDDIFNPVVPEWTAEVQRREEKAKQVASHLIFYIGDPMVEESTLSAYSMVEATMALYDSPVRTIVAFDTRGLDKHSMKSVRQTYKVLSTRFSNSYPWLKDAIILIQDDSDLKLIVNKIVMKVPIEDAA